MKKFLLALMLLGFSFFAFTQEIIKGDLQIGVNGGGSLPVGEYKSLPDTKLGYYSGFFIDKYFKANKFGIGADVRYIYNDINRQDSFYFKNGFMETSYNGKSRFQNYLFVLGPSYKYTKNRFHLEAYARGGVMMQYFPEYVQSITYDVRTGGGAIQTITTAIKYTTNDSSNKAYSWASLVGLRVNYSVSRNLHVFAHLDYVQSLGSRFGSKSSLFRSEEYLPIESNPLLADSYVESSSIYFGEQKLIKGIHHQSINTGVGVKYVFGAKKLIEKIETQQGVKYDDIPKVIAKNKDIQIVVKDKQTNIALSGVTVLLGGNGVIEKSITDANGQAERLLAVVPGSYEVYGEKNGIQTPLLTLTEADFKGNTQVILKELYHDDPRFTLVGETFDCNLERNMSNINTVLTNSSSKISMSQISDMEGKFIYQLEPERDYTVIANQQGRYSQTEMVTTKGLSRSHTLYVTLKLGVCDLVKDGTWVLKNIFYDFDKSEIRADAASVLDNVVSVMHANPSLRIELSSHTDSRGNDSYNLKLSQRRADAAVAYLVNKGIEKKRLVAKGYGETKLINTCFNGIDCSEFQHQENRRTEIRILEYSN